MVKKVNFNLNNNKIHYTYSKDEYDRHQIDSTLYLYCYNRITYKEWLDIMIDLNIYKINEMIVHIDSIQNIKLFE